MSSIENKLSCKLTSPELRQRKTVVIATLKELVLEKQETTTGFRYKFNGRDQTLDIIHNFIKTERRCCEFFTFSLEIGSTEDPVWLELSGPEGTKSFIMNEIQF